MKSKAYIYALLVILSVAMTGCFTRKNLENPENLSAAEAVSTAAGTILGGMAGSAASDGDPGETAIGAVAGGATAYGVSNLAKNRKSEEYQYEQERMRNAGMIQDFEDSWDAQVQRPLSHEKGPKEGRMAKYLQPINYPAGVYEGVRYHTRSIDPRDPDPLNPKR